MIFFFQIECGKTIERTKVLVYKVYETSKESWKKKVYFIIWKLIYFIDGLIDFRTSSLPGLSWLPENFHWTFFFQYLLNTLRNVVKSRSMRKFTYFEGKSSKMHFLLDFHQKSVDFRKLPKNEMCIKKNFKVPKVREVKKKFGNQRILPHIYKSIIHWNVEFDQSGIVKVKEKCSRNIWLVKIVYNTFKFRHNLIRWKWTQERREIFLNIDPLHECVIRRCHCW